MDGKRSLAAAVLLFTVLFLIWQHRRRNATRLHKGYGLLAQHQPWEPFMGLDFLMSIINDVTRVHHLTQRYGHTFQVNALVRLPDIVTVAPENVRVINSRDHEWGIQPYRLPGMEFFCGRGFLTMDGEAWRHSRKSLKPSFNKNNLVDLSILSREIDKLLEQLPKDGTTVDLQPPLYIVFLNTSLYFLLGISDGRQDEAPCTSEEFVSSFHDALFFTMIRMTLGPIWKFVPKGKFLRVCATAHGYLDYYINRALSGEDGSKKGSKSTMTQSLIQGLSSQTDDAQFIRSQVLQGMMASQETTSSLLGNTFFLLARYPKYWQEVRAEVLEKGDSMLDFDALLENKVLQNILLESLRLYPIFPQISRAALCDTTLPTGGGANGDAPIFVPKGTRVELGYYALHRDPRVFGDDVEAFRPERWDSINPGQWEFMGFGGGSRACLGKQKSLVEAAYVLARMAMHFETLESRDDKPWHGEIKLTCKNLNGCKVALHPVGK